MSKRYKSSEVTRQAIAGALKELMAVKPLERITVAEIMTACGMRRQHFYYYFNDVYDLVRWMFEAEAVELLRRQEGVHLWQEGFLQLFQYINENRAVCLCALDSLGREALKRFFETDVNSIVDRAVRQVAVQNGFPECSAEADMVICLVTIMLAGAVESWLRGELRQTPGELTGRIDEMFRDYICGVALRMHRQSNGVSQG